MILYYTSYASLLIHNFYVIFSNDLHFQCPLWSGHDNSSSNQSDVGAAVISAWCLLSHYGKYWGVIEDPDTALTHYDLVMPCGYEAIIWTNVDIHMKYLIYW